MNTASDLNSRMREAARRLTEIDAGNPILEAQYLMSRALSRERVEIFRLADTDPLPAGALEEFDRLLAERLRRSPLQYVLGTALFCDLELLVGPGVLIPRSETEGLVERVLRALVHVEHRRAPRLLIDVGTGSGAILLALLQHLPGWYGVGIDPSAIALSWAARNVAKNAAASSGPRARLVRGVFLEGIRPGRADLVVSNPPYIRTADLASLAPEIRDHEPRTALDGGEDGLDVVRGMLPSVLSALRAGGLFALELAPEQPERVRDILRATGEFDEAEIHPDLAGRPRVVMARRRLRV